MFARNQTCSICGTALEIFEDGKLISVGYSPFDADRHVIEQPPKTTSPQHKAKDSSTPDKQKSS